MKLTIIPCKEIENCALAQTFSKLRCCDDGLCVRTRFDKLYSELIEPASRKIFQTVKKKTGLSIEDMEDVMQDSLIKMYRHLLRNPTLKSPLGFFYTVVHNTAFDKAKNKPVVLGLPMSHYFEQESWLKENGFYIEDCLDL